jgi:hypothetical protein
MNPIGGELAIQSLSENVFFTDSGRSSLRLIIRSGNQNKKFLIPDYFCEIIESVFIQEKVKYDFYHILDDLSVDAESLAGKDFDVFYVINYFGKDTSIKGLDIDQKIIIEDNVFLYNFENKNNFKYWYGFNSFRKVSILADGSLIKTNLNIDYDQIKRNEAGYSEIKYHAKNLKHKYLGFRLGDEKTYLDFFERGELLLSEQRDIFGMSSKSIFRMMLCNVNQQDISRDNYSYLYQKFGSLCLNANVDFFSYFVMLVPQRDELRKFLFSKNVYLPIHWPQSTQYNELYHKVISIPIFSSYSIEDIRYISDLIEVFYGKN